MTDPYESVTCPKCGQKWQRIDWNCALHQMSCGEQDQPVSKPLAYGPPSEEAKRAEEKERQRIRDYWDEEARKLAEEDEKYDRGY